MDLDIMEAPVGTEDITAALALAVVIGHQWVAVCIITVITTQWAAECGTVIPITEDAAAVCSP